MIGKVKFAEQVAYQKSKEYSVVKEENHMKIIESYLPDVYHNVAKLVHFVVFNEQNTTSSYYIKQFLDKIWKLQLSFKIS